MATTSALHCEHIIVSGSNNKFDLVNNASTTFVVTVTSGIYRDGVALAAQIDADIVTAGMTNPVVSCAFSVAAGKFSLTADTPVNFELDWNTSSYGTTLRDQMGYASGGSGAQAYISDNLSEGSFIPTEPVEMDDRPEETGSDLFTLDVYQSEARSGNVATTGGRLKIFNREIQLLLSSSELDEFADWCEVAARGLKVAFYHDVSETWPGPSDEYKQYWWFGGEDSLGYTPGKIEDMNKAWHRQLLTLRQVVE